MRHQKRYIVGKLVLSVAFGAFLTTTVQSATTRTWVGPAAGDWFTAANWLAADASEAVPEAGDSVVITGGSLTVASRTAALASLTVSNATITLANWTTALEADDMRLQNGAIITLPPAFEYPAAMSNRIHLIAHNFVLESGGSINVNGLGYLVANGPAKGAQSGSNNNGGGGHGGRGGDENNGSGGSEWGVPERPEVPGSGGGRWTSSAYPTKSGCGGGVVLIEATNVVVNGAITANGTVGLLYDGGGAGGAVWIKCDTFTGTNGTIRADGGEGGVQYGGGGGGGGRIALDYATFDPACTVQFSTKPGALHTAIPASAGTLWLADNTSLYTGLETLFDYVCIIIPGHSECVFDTLIFSNHNVALNMENISLVISNDLCVSGNANLVIGNHLFASRASTSTEVYRETTNINVTVHGDITVAGATLSVGNAGQFINPNVQVGGDINITGENDSIGQLYMTSGVSTNMEMIGGKLDIAGSLNIASNGWLYPYSQQTNGASVEITAAETLIAAGGGISASGAGYASLATVAYGPGAGKSAGSRGGGGGYGGQGGKGAAGDGGAIYGEAIRPLLPGSAGGFGYSPGPGRAFGGGHLRLETGAMVLDGLIVANGKNSASQYGGGGSGGGIFVFAAEFSGSSSGGLQAKGGHGGSVGGGGGGGRIAVALGLTPSEREALISGADVTNLLAFDDYAQFTGNIDITNGLSGSSGWNPQPTPGTFTYLTIANRQGVALDIRGDPDCYGSPTPNHYGITALIEPNTVITNSVGTPADEENGTRRASIGWSLTDSATNFVTASGLQPAIFTLSTNMVLTWRWTNEYFLAIISPTNGTVNSTEKNGWYTNGVTVANIAATPDSGYKFNHWSGDVPAELSYDNPLTINMDQPRTVYAVFSSLSGEEKRWNGTGAWEESGNWLPLGMPGPYDAAIIESGNVTLSEAQTVGSLVVSNGATLTQSGWNSVLTVAGNATVAGTITLPSPFKYDQEMSNRVWIICNDFELTESGIISVGAKGFFTHTGPGKGGGTGSNHGSGGGHGGRGGKSDNASGGTAYGFAYAPQLPGSGGGGTYDNAGGHGGGAVWIDAVNDVLIAGTINANGGGGATYNGGGAGGSIFIIAGHAFTGTETATLIANGGNRGGGYTQLGGGAGGRIAVWYKSLTPEERAMLLAGEEPKRTEVKEDFDDYLGLITADAAVNSHQPPEDGTIVFLRVAPPPGTMLLIK